MNTEDSFGGLALASGPWHPTVWIQSSKQGRSSQGTEIGEANASQSFWNKEGAWL